jgi:hypothetical protein
VAISTIKVPTIKVPTIKVPTIKVPTIKVPTITQSLGGDLGVVIGVISHQACFCTRLDGLPVGALGAV